MKFRLRHLAIVQSKAALAALPPGKCLICTINAHSYNVARADTAFAEALCRCDALIADGISIVKACRWIGAKSQPTERCAGWDLFVSEMQRLEASATPSARKKVMFVGSSEQVLGRIKERAARDYPDLEVVTLSPPYAKTFTPQENAAIVAAINATNPDLLWIGMTAPKQEKWAQANWPSLSIHCHCGCIGAVFDFYAGTMKRAPLWWQRHGLEWLYRLLREPRRMWRRYLVGNALFIGHIIGEKFTRQ